MNRRKSFNIHFFAGLGNQLFQFAYAHLIKQRLECELTFTIDKKPRPDRTFELYDLIQECNHLVESDYESVNADFFQYRVLSRVFRSNLLSSEMKSYISSLTGFEINPYGNSFLTKSSSFNRNVVGYFQHWQLIEQAWHLMGTELQNYLHKSIPSNRFAEKNEDYILLHIRRGDLVNLLDSMGALSVQYYSNALKLIPNFESKRLTVVTDDVSGAADICDQLAVSCVYGPSNLSPWETLNLMSNSKYFIMANSTLSWWGGYLSIQNNPESICVLPEPWFLNWHQSTGDALAYPKFLISKSDFISPVKFTTDFKYS